MALLDYIKEIDTQLFLFFNSKHSPFWDTVMYWLSEKFFWIPFYAILLVVIGIKLKWKSLILVLPIVVLVITLSDQLSVHLFKNMFERYRPCHNLQIQELVHLVSGCGGKYGFISSHAANSFALATFIGLLLKSKVQFILPAMVIWAALVSYSRIYNGVHYPADIVIGAFLGIAIGLGCFKLYAFLKARFAM